MRIALALLMLISAAAAQEQRLNALYESLASATGQFGIPSLDLGYRENLEALQNTDRLLQQQRHFNKIEKQFSALDTSGWSSRSRLRANAMAFELMLHRERIRLGLRFNSSGRVIPAGGLFHLHDGKEWYVHFLKRFTGLDLTPEQIMAMGESEVAKIREAMRENFRSLGWPDSGNHAALQADEQFLFSKDSIRFHFHRTDSIARSNLGTVFLNTELAPVEPIEWQNADMFTPPGIYLGKQNNAFGVDVFMYNFYGGRFPMRCLDWLYLHEAIPGHHLHSQYLRAGFYFGTSEGWACYVEKLGETLGLYSDPFRKLGEQEWDLVRSVRLVLDVGIHYLGWTEEQAQEYWKRNIRGQDSIAIREIRRVTGWPVQAVCYKAGALAISQIVGRLTSGGSGIREAHQWVLEHSDLPLEALARFEGSSKKGHPASQNR